MKDNQANHCKKYPPANYPTLQ